MQRPDRSSHQAWFWTKSPRFPLRKDSRAAKLAGHTQQLLIGMGSSLSLHGSQEAARHLSVPYPAVDVASSFGGLSPQLPAGANRAELPPDAKEHFQVLL